MMMNRKIRYSNLLTLALVLKFSFGTFSAIPKNNPLANNHLRNDNLNELNLTEDEQKWLKEHPVITVGAEPNWAPFEFKNKQGNFQGIDIDYLHLFEKKLNVHFKFANEKNWNTILNKAKNKEIDILSSVSMTEQRTKYFDFTEIYNSCPISIFANKETTYIRNINELNHKKVVVIEGYYTLELLKNIYPELNIITAPTPIAALKMLKNKDVFAYIEGMLVGSYYISEYNFKDLKLVGHTPYNYNLRIAIRKDWQILQSILNKTLASISEGEKENIHFKWMSSKTKKEFNLKLLIKILFIPFIIIIFSLYWNRKLRKEVKQREQAQQDLKNAIKELKNTQTHLVQSEKMSTVGVLTAGVAHEIKNPLSYIMMGIDGIKTGVEAYEEIISAYEEIHLKLSEQELKNIQKLKEDLDYKYYRYECESLTKTVGEGIENIHEITKSLNTFSYFAGKEMVLGDINKGIKSTLVLLRSQYKYNIEIIENLNNIPKIKCFPGKLNQIYVNLISNAIQAIEDKGTITIKTFIENGFTKISIKDTGKGMSDDEVKNIFDAFYTTKPIGKGTGLGLAITKNIINEHNGSIEVKSEKGIGTEFIVSLPLNEK